MRALYLIMIVSYVALILFLLVSLYRGLVRSRIFDIRAAIMRTGAYALSLITLAGVYYMIVYFISLFILRDTDLKYITSQVSPLNAVVAVLLAFIFQPVKRFFDKVTDKFFYKKSYNSDEFIVNLNNTLSNATNLEQLLKNVSKDIARTMKAKFVFFSIKASSDDFVSYGTKSWSRLPQADIDELTAYSDQNGGVTIASRLEPTDSVYALMHSHRIEIVLQLKHSNQTVGLLFIGEREISGYSKRDLRVLMMVTNELVIAIQNALYVQKILDLNYGLQERVHDATKELRSSNSQLQRLDKAKDEFVSMASHQLRTPLTSVKGYISMVLEGDVGKITDAQRKVLSEAFTSSERMVHLINDFLNVSRLQTGKFLIEKTPVDLDLMVRQELNSLETTAKSRGLTFKYKGPKKALPQLMLDDSKVRQVIMNFADNAIFYSPKASKIEVELAQKGDKIVFKVKDHGIGVPRSERSQLFTKFYRASNARKQRPDGTGVGIFLAKKVIDAHDGKIIFESTEGKGSVFGFELSEKDLKVQE